MYEWTNRYFHMLEKQLDPFSENMLTISICKNEEMDMSCSFHIQGKLNDQEISENVLFTSLATEQTIEFCECRGK